MRGYAEYRDTNTFWLGAMPKHWHAKNIRTITKQIVERNQPHLPLLSVYRDYGVILKDSRDDNYNRAGEDLAQYKVVKPGRLVLNKMKTWQGSLGVSEYDGIVSPAYITCDLDAAQNPRYIHFLLRSQPYIIAYNQISYGVRVDQWDMRYEDFKQLPVFLPPTDEQDAIVAFLDGKLAEIDRFIANKERLIALLKEQKAAVINRAVTRGLDADAPMKPSGIEWLGEIPAHWEMKPLKYVAALQTGLTLGKDYVGKQLVTRPYLRVANVQDGYLDLSDITYIDIPDADVRRYELRTGDVLMTEGGDFDKLGRGFIWEGQIDDCLHQNHIFAVRPKGTLLAPRFLAALMSSTYGKLYFTVTSKQTTNLASTNSTTLRNFQVLLPPIVEQEQILCFIQTETSQCDTAVSKAEREIELIKEYRTALIADAVTGKIDVRAAVAERVEEEVAV